MKRREEVLKCGWPCATVIRSGGCGVCGVGAVVCIEGCGGCRGSQHFFKLGTSNKTVESSKNNRLKPWVS